MNEKQQRLNGHDSNPYFPDEARDIVGMVVKHVASDQRFEGRRDLLTVARLIRRGDVEAFAAMTPDREGDEVA